MNVKKKTPIKMYSVVYWSKDNGWWTQLYGSKLNAECCSRTKNFVGMSEVDCLLPLDKVTDNEEKS